MNIKGPARLLALTLCAWLDADVKGDEQSALFAARAAAHFARALPPDDPLAPLLERHLVAGHPRDHAAAVACVLAIMAAADAPRGPGGT